MDNPGSGGDRSGSPVEAQAAGLHDQIKRLEETVRQNQNRINQLENPAFELGRRAFSAADPTARTEVTDDTEVSRDYMCLTAKKTIPRVRECTFAEFKNRFHPKGEDGHFAVDVLLSGALLRQEIREEHKLRERLFEQHKPEPATKIVSSNDKALAKVVKITNATSCIISKSQKAEKWPRRIRIQAPALLRIMARLNREKSDDRPRTYHRPFNLLIYHQSQMRQALKELEERWGPTLDGNAAPVARHETDETDENGDDEDDQSVIDSPQALACMRAYVKYIEDNIMHDYHRFEDKDFHSGAKVRFSDLWFLFRTGELVYRKIDDELTDARDFRTGKRIWKTYYVNSVPERIMVAAADADFAKDTAVINDEVVFSIGGYYVDHTGEEFCVVKKRFEIEPFSGEVPVSDLPVFPIRFCQDWKGRLDHAIQSGDKLIDFLKSKHCSYSGWTLTRDPSGEPTTDANGLLLQQPEHINSEVMVDFGEAFQACPSWKPTRGIMRSHLIDSLTVQDEFRLRWWSNIDRTRLMGETAEMIPVRTGVVTKQRNNYITADPFLVAVNENAKRARLTTEKDLTGDARALLTGRVFAYVFQERKFAQLSVSKLRPSPKTGLALDSLKIPPTVKHAILGSIQGHFLHKQAERKIDQHWSSLDLIQGKGAGLFILLHGVPGVGKTATAEAIAQACGKPLFKITAGELGMTPEGVESSLRGIFRLASIWDCILLLDEVDTFFSQRSRADTATNKNALVSVFLRVLDYYDGVLFLTTNRAGVLDEAFKSRIHYKIYYPDLTLEQTRDIWRLNIQRISKIEEELSKVEKRLPLRINENELLAFAEHHFVRASSQKGGPSHWNGRQIRNAFQVARSLAYYEHGLRREQLARGQSAGNTDASIMADARDGSLAAPTLDVRHFQTMYDITASFDNYRTAVRGGITDADLALEGEFRHDRYQDSLTQNLQDEYRDIHQRAATSAAGGRDGSSDGAPSNVAVTTTVALTPGQHRPRYQQYGGDGDGYSVGGDFATNNQHRGSGGLRPRSGSYRSNVGAGSPPNPGFEVASTHIHQHQQQGAGRFAPSPRQGPMVDLGGVEPSGNYSLSRGGGYPSQQYRDSSPMSPRHLHQGHNPGPSGLRPQPQQYEPGSMAATSRGASPAVGEGGVAMGVNGDRRGRDREYDRQEYYSPEGPNFSSPAGRDALGVSGRHGSDGWGDGGGVPGGQQGGRYLAAQFAGQIRDGPRDRQGPEVNVETDLSLDTRYS